MPRQVPPTFDYYAELEVERTASLDQITSSYRNLSRSHHPDRNFGREQEATAKFQRVQQAYEVLSNPTERRHYNSTTSGSASNSSLFRNEGDFGDGNWPYGYHESFWPEFFERFGFNQTFFAAYNAVPSGDSESSDREPYRNIWERVRDLRRQQARDREQEDLVRRREREALDERSRRAKAEWNVSRAAKQAFEARNRAHACEEEKNSQEQRWKEKAAVTVEEKRLTCLHSSFCVKVEQKKFQCSACSARRGMIAFECPHCSASICQLCMDNFSTKRQKLTWAKSENRTAGSFQGSANNNNNKTSSPPSDGDTLSAEPQDSSSDQPSSQEKHGKLKKPMIAKKNVVGKDKTSMATDKTAESLCEDDLSTSGQQDLVADETPHEEASHEAATPTDQAASQSSHSQPPQARPAQGSTSTSRHLASVRPVKTQHRVTASPSRCCAQPWSVSGPWRPSSCAAEPPTWASQTRRHCVGPWRPRRSFLPPPSASGSPS